MSAMHDDRLLSAWLFETAPIREPEHLLGEVLARTARTRRRPAWRNPERFDLMSAISTRLAPESPVPWRLVSVAALLLLGLALAIVAISGGSAQRPAPPFGLAANGGIVYSNGGDIVSIDPLTGAVRTLVSGPADDEVPIYSPDGSRMSFFRGPDGDTGVWVANADGSSAHQVAGPWPGFPASIDWSPSGDLLAMNSVDGSDEAIILVRTDGSGTSTIHTGLRNVDFPVFRPTSGDQISFRAMDANGDFGLYIVDRDGTNLQQLALDLGFQDDAFYTENREYYFNDLAWDSSGTHILFHTLEPDTTSVAGPGFRIHVADVDASGAVNNERILQFNGAEDDEFAAIFIPETSDIVYRQIEGETQTLMRGSTLPGGSSQSLGISAPDWLTVVLSPDGKQLIVTVPDGRPGPSQTRHVVLLDLATLVTTPISLPDDYSWQRLAPAP